MRSSVSIPKRKKEFDFRDRVSSVFQTPHGLSKKIVQDISQKKQEPDWMLKLRLQALEIFYEKKLPDWGADLSEIDFDAMTYYIRPLEKASDSWDDVPEKIKNTFERLGIPQAERKFLAGVGAQYESEVIYHRLQERFTALGVIFCDMSEAPKKYPDLVKKYFGTVIPVADNKFAALNSAVWSGGSFIYVPKGVKVDMPLQAYFRINAPAMGQFERTLIIADEGSSVHYIEGCTAPMYSKHSLHAAVVELIALKGAHIRYTTIQNWSQNVYNLVTKRAVAAERAVVEWIDGNLGSKVTMKYPCVILQGPYARADILSIACAGSSQHQDAGAKVIHLAPHTASNIVSRSIAKDGGRTSYRGLVKVTPLAHGCRIKVRCDALLLDASSRSDTYPTMQIDNPQTHIEHEASVSRLDEQQVYYLQSRGLTRQEAERLMIMGFLDVFSRELPMEYAVELNRLIAIEMEGAIA